jgi:hypothetical protein
MNLFSVTFLYSVTCCLVGLIALLLLPALAKNTYISENALIPGIDVIASLTFHENVCSKTHLLRVYLAF